MGEKSYPKTLFILCVVLMVYVLRAHQVFQAEAKGPVAFKPVDRNAVGCILPLTGRNAAAGNSALDAVVLASGVFDPIVKTPIRLVIEDSRSRPEIAREAVGKLVREDGVVCILGPVGTDESLAAAEEAQKLKVPIITLTDKEDITAIGNYVFRFYMTSRMQVVSLVDYVMQEMGLKRFAILCPKDHYGNEMEKLFREEALRRKGEVLKVISYATTETDFATEIKCISDLIRPSLPGEKGGGYGNGNKPDEDLEALFIPDIPSRISMIVPQLAFHDVRGIKLIGTSLWDTPDILKAGSELLEGSVFVDAFSPSSFYPEANDFADVYYTNYRREPDAAEALVYDAAAIIVKIIREDITKTRDQFRESLLNLRDYRGVTGKTSFSGVRDARKDMIVLTIKDGQIVQIR